MNSYMADVAPRRNLPEAIAGESKLCEDILQTVETLREATNSQNMEFYLFDSRKHELFRCPRAESESYRATRFKIGPGSIMAAYVAHTQKPLICHDIVKSKLFPLGVDRIGSAAMRGMCIPVLTGRRQLIGVVELIKESGYKTYTQIEFEMCINMCNWMVPSIENFFTEKTLRMENQLYSDLINDMVYGICGHKTHRISFSELLEITNRILNTESYAFYIKYRTTDNDVGLRKASMFIPVEQTFGRKQCINLQTVKSVASTVMIEKRIVTAMEEDFKSKFNTSMYEPQEVVSSIGIPLMSNGTIKGALEYINKIDSDRFYIEDRLVLSALTAFIEFNLFAGSLLNRTTKAKLHIKIDHDKFKRSMRLSKYQELKYEEFKLHKSPEERLAIPNDESTFMWSFDKMFLDVVPKWTEYKPLSRVKFLSSILNFTIVHSPIVWEKIWSSVDFVCSILKTYLPHFTDVEKELMMYATLCRAIKSQHCGKNCQCSCPTEISLSKTPICNERCNAFYFIRAHFQMTGCCAVGCTNRDSKGFLMKRFPRDPKRRKQWEVKVSRANWKPTSSSYLCEKVGLMDSTNLAPLIRKLKVILHSINPPGIKGIKENLFRIIARKQFDTSNLDHRIWLRTVILSLAGDAVYFKPGVLHLDKILDLAEQFDASPDRDRKEKNYLLEIARKKKHITKTMALHLKLNVLPYLILLRTIFPETKIYVIYCLQAIKRFESIKIEQHRHLENNEMSEKKPNL